MAQEKFYATGKRKNAVARVWLVPGSGKIVVNKMDAGEYFGRIFKDHKFVNRLPLKQSGLLTRDPRMKERKKYGQKGARAKFQFSKR